MDCNNKHAFLIMAHTQPKLLKRLLNRLDHNRVDIFLHLDKKASLLFNEKELRDTLKHSKLYLTRRLNVTWGDYSMILAELELLTKAINIYKYNYYHLLTGQDYILKNIDGVLNFYDKTPDVNYISFKYNEAINYIDRLRLTYPFQDLVGRTHGGLYYLQRILNKIQKELKLYRKIPDSIGFGSQFFDITDDFARWIVENKDNWEHIYKNTVCADEMFVQTLYLQYSKEKQAKLCDQIEGSYYTFDSGGRTINRAIDWKRGNPYVWIKDDYEILQSSGLLFVRKVDETKSLELLNILDEMKR